MVRFFFAIAALFFSAPALAQSEIDVLSPAEFRDHLVAHVNAVEGYSVTPLEDTRLIVRNGDQEARVNIQDAYDRYLADPAALPEVINVYVATILEATTENKLDDLVILINSVDFIENSMSPEFKDRFLASRGFVGDLAMFLAIDSPRMVRLVSPNDLSDWGITEVQAWAIALQSTPERNGQLTLSPAKRYENAYLITAEGGLGASALADPEFCGPQGNGELEGSVALLTSNEMFLIGHPGLKGSLEGFWNAARNVVETGQSASETPLLCQDGKWVAIPFPEL